MFLFGDTRFRKAPLVVLIGISVIYSIRSLQRELQRSKPAPDPVPQSYSWIGNHWIPENGIPTYGARDMTAVFRKHNTLWLGDSTARQDFATLHAIVSAAPSHVSLSALRAKIDVNKEGLDDPCGRDLSDAHVRGVLAEDPKDFVCWEVPGSEEGRGKFDVWQKGRCARDLVDVVELERNETAAYASMLREYDVVVVAIGTWDVIGEWEEARCPADVAEDYERTLTALRSLRRVASPQLTVFWKTHGPWLWEKRQRTDALNDRIRRWFRRESPEYMHLIDFGKVILPRSLNDSRIEGDLRPHWGVEARTLFAQMLTHAVITNDD